jgi:photosystem II stability/assembly factor-like uncharacterized protein|tara:strand:+ start:973 stop:1191 length:219 start_codon:yes stop_codon:yes gene_type:complete
MTAEIIKLSEYKKKKEYPMMGLSDEERQELLSQGYDPDSFSDVTEYWEDILEAAEKGDPGTFSLFDNPSQGW